MKFTLTIELGNAAVFVDVDEDKCDAMKLALADAGMSQLGQKPYVANGTASFQLTETAWGTLRPVLLQLELVEEEGS
jgi:hypothetical protein